MARKMGTDYAAACQQVAERIKHGDARSPLLRMAGSLSSGEDEADFLRREAEVIGEAFGNQYQRDVEALKKWTDAYVTLLVASGLIVIVAVISMMIYQVGVVIIVGLAFMMVGATCLGAWIIYASAPREIKTRITGPSSSGQLLGTKLFKMMAPPGLAVGSILILLGFPLSWALILLAVFLFPAGLIINRDDGRLSQSDADISTMVPVLGGMTASLGTTVNEALGRIDRRSMGSLMPEVTRLRFRLTAGIDPNLCWQALVDEVGSEVVDRTIQMFWKPLSLGGDPARIGASSAFYSSRIAYLRAARSMVASTFKWLALPLHLAMVGLLEFIVEIMRLFNASIGANSELLSVDDLGLPAGIADVQLMTFGQVNMTLIHILVTVVVLVLTGANAYAPKAADGGHTLKIAYNLSIMLLITGALMLAVPMLAISLFSTIVTG